MIYNGRQFKQNPRFLLQIHPKTLDFGYVWFLKQFVLTPHLAPSCKGSMWVYQIPMFQVLWLDLFPECCTVLDFMLKVQKGLTSIWLQPRFCFWKYRHSGRVPLANSHLWGWQSPDVIAIHPATLAFWHVVFLFKR